MNKIISTKDVKEPNKTPDPIFLIFDFSELLFRIKYPKIRLEIIIKSIK